MVRMVNSPFSFVKTRCKFEQCKQIQTHLEMFADALSCRVPGKKFTFSRNVCYKCWRLKLNSRCRQQFKYLSWKIFCPVQAKIYYINLKNTFTVGFNFTCFVLSVIRSIEPFERYQSRPNIKSGHANALL